MKNVAVTFFVPNLIYEWPLSFQRVFIVGIGVSTPLKNTTPFFLPSPALDQQTVQGNPPYILVFQDPPLKIGSFSQPPKY